MLEGEQITRGNPIATIDEQLGAVRKGLVCTEWTWSSLMSKENFYREKCM